MGGNTIRETQAKIDQLIGMDYTTFINSAFLMQGRADEFTKKTPAERKTVLSSLLGLEAYDRLQARARARGRPAGPPPTARPVTWSKWAGKSRPSETSLLSS